MPPDFPSFTIKSQEFRLNKRKLWKMFWAGITLSFVGVLILIPVFSFLGIDKITNQYIQLFLIGAIAKYIFEVID